MVHKRVLVVFFALLMTSCSLTVGAGRLPQIFEKQSVSVAIKKIEGSCSRIELIYHVNEFGKDVIIPRNVVGFGGVKFSLEVLSLKGNDRLPMLIVPDEGNDGVVHWNMEDSPYVVNVNLADYFNLKKGDYYIEYLYSFKPSRLDLDYDAWFYDLVKSERYYIEIDSGGCISKFLN